MSCQRRLIALNTQCTAGGSPDGQLGELWHPKPQPSLQLCAQLDAVLIAEDGGIVSLAIDGYQVRIRMAAQSLPCAAAWPG